MQKNLSEQNQKIVGILTIYSESKYSHRVNGLCHYFREAFRDIAGIYSYAFFDLFVQGYLTDDRGYCEKRQILVNMIIDLLLEFNPTLKWNKDGNLTFVSRKKGFKEAFNMIRYYGGYR